MEVSLPVTSSWDLGGSWVKPEGGSMTLVSSETEITGPREFDGTLPFPGDPKVLRSFYRNVAVVALPDPQRRSGWEFVYELPNGIPRELDHAALYNAPGRFAATQFTDLGSQSGT
jgi:hypothetical protein